jgi:hypothetical protein
MALCMLANGERAPGPPPGTSLADVQAHRRRLRLDNLARVSPVSLKRARERLGSKQSGLSASIQSRRAANSQPLVPARAVLARRFLVQLQLAVVPACLPIHPLGFPHLPSPRLPVQSRSLTRLAHTETLNRRLAITPAVFLIIARLQSAIQHRGRCANHNILCLQRIRARLSSHCTPLAPLERRPLSLEPGPHSRHPLAVHWVRLSANPDPHNHHPRRALPQPPPTANIFISLLSCPNRRAHLCCPLCFEKPAGAAHRPIGPQHPRNISTNIEPLRH